MMSSSAGESAFYDTVAAKFGGYSVELGEPTHRRFAGADPEAVFEELVRRYVSSGAHGLDIGCADGRHTLELAPSFGHLTGIDLSQGMLEVGRRLLAEQQIANAGFEARDASHTGYEDASFDLVYSRRGPTFYGEFARLLRPGGVYVEIQIGDQDTRALKEQFGRGQDYGGWDTPALGRNTEALRSVGLEVIEAADYYLDDFYRDLDHFCEFLEGVPIFTDFDRIADLPHLEAYIAGHTGAEGIVLPRHRVVIAARKPA
jgi:SAM-dependent methyltransferase